MTREQARWAYRMGVQRIADTKADGRRYSHQWTPTDAEAKHVSGMAAVAEYFVALTTRRPWMAELTTGPDDPNVNDVAGGISVRWTPRENGSLIVHQTEPDHLVCVLVVGPTYPVRIVGWIPISECKQQLFWKTNVRNPAFFVPQSEVSKRHISELGSEDSWRRNQKTRTPSHVTSG